MITKEMIDRINFLSRKSKSEEGLTDTEKAEQQVLRKKYIEYIKGQVRQQLDSIKYVDEDGYEVEKHHNHLHGECNCGCKDN